MKTKEIIAYKQGQNWMVNNNGEVYSLPHYVMTKKDVILYYKEIEDADYKVIFA